MAHHDDLQVAHRGGTVEERQVGGDLRGEGRVRSSDPERVPDEDYVPPLEAYGQEVDIGSKHGKHVHGNNCIAC
jgi:hypothetical protein